MKLLEIEPGHWIDPDEVVAVEPTTFDGKSRVYFRRRHYVILSLTPSEVVDRLRKLAEDERLRLADEWAESVRKQGPGPIHFAPVVHSLDHCCLAGAQASPGPCPHHGWRVTSAGTSTPNLPRA